MNNITLKLATEKDIQIYIDLERSAIDSRLYAGVNETLAEAIEEFKNNKIYFIKKEDKIVGSVSYEIKSSSHAFINGLVVNPEFQKQGIGREALKQILEMLKSFKRIDLVTHPDNTPAIKLYEHFGFVIESKKENYFGDGEPRVVLVRKN